VRPAVLLDRDGVLDEAVLVDGRPRPPAGPGDLRLLPGAAAACRRLRAAGLPLIVVTNQPDVARGTADMATVDAINRELRRRLPLDDVLVCPHDDADRCGCRKPAPGLLRAAARAWALDPRRSVMVGDRWRDVEAGRSAGCATVLIGDGYGERAGCAADLVAGSLAEAVGWIVRTAGRA
jgi:D-glycero-D-manno-heptose 1,7-bisphosphate phosphatase